MDRNVGTGDRLVSIHRAQMTARHSGIEVRTPLAHLWTFRAGKVVRIRSYADPAAALGDAGLSE